MSERLRFGETRGRRLHAGSASGARSPGSEVLLERSQLRFVETEQHDPDIVQPERGLRHLAGRLFLERELEPERAALAQRAIQSDLPAHHLDELLCYRRAETGPAVAARGRVGGLKQRDEFAFVL